jgi:hypothetical protein
MDFTPDTSVAVATLRRFAARPATRLEVCDLCGASLAPQHAHLIAPADRRLVCACDACAMLLDRPGSKFVRVPREVRRLSAPLFTGGRWDALSIPIGLAFFFFSSSTGRVVAMYPGAAGATESMLPVGTWEELAAGQPVPAVKPDVEALLVNRVDPDLPAGPSEYVVPIDVCYRLVGLIRAKWRGFSGGTEAWAAIDQFFSELDAQAEEMCGISRA